MSDFSVVLGPGTDVPREGFVSWSRPATRMGGREGLADATLRSDRNIARRLPRELRDRIGGASRATSEPLIIAAFEALGDDALHALEGDFAFVCWDAARRRLLAARDFAGKRSLFYAWHGGALHVGTTIGPVLSDPAVPRAIDLATVATVGAGLWAHSAATGYAAVRELPAGWMLTWEPGREPVAQPYWRAPDAMATRRAPLDDSAAELRSLLRDAVRDRLADDGSPTVVTLSGGWDSTAVYAIAQSLVLDGEARGPVHSVSISYPEGDPGREDELIAAVTAHWGAAPDFIPVDTIPLAVDWVGEAARREQPFAHAYEHWNRALHRRAHAHGARVLLDGIGGDQLFQASDIFLADLFRTFQWGELLRQHRVRPGAQRSWRELYQWAVRPNVPLPLQRLIARARGVPIAPHYLERFPPIWFRRDFLASHGVVDRERAERPGLPAHPFVLAEGHAYLRFAFYPRIFAHLHRFGREEGVELRSPLLDERIVRFALARPWSDRVDGLETKLLLRRAMRGLLPDDVLAPRTHRTGTTNAYFLRELRRAAWPVAEPLLGDLRLAALGIVDPAIYRRAWDHLLAHDDDELAVRVFFTLQAELWLRTRDA